MTDRDRLDHLLREFATNISGPLSGEAIRRVSAYLDCPCTDHWSDVAGLLVRGRDLRTLWQAILAVNPDFPRQGRTIAADGTLVADWTAVPSADLILRALSASLAEERATFEGDAS